MKFLLDQNLSPVLVGLLEQAGHSACHVRDLEMSEAADDVILAEANRQEAVLISADTDFGGSGSDAGR